MLYISHTYDKYIIAYLSDKYILVYLLNILAFISSVKSGFFAFIFR